LTGWSSSQDEDQPANSSAVNESWVTIERKS